MFFKETLKNAQKKECKRTGSLVEKSKLYFLEDKVVLWRHTGTVQAHTLLHTTAHTGKFNQLGHQPQSH